MRAVVRAAILFSLALQPGGTSAPLQFLRAIELPRVEGRIDHLALDSTGQKLFVAALGNNTVEVVDVKGGTHVRSLPGFREPQGIARLTDARMMAVANGQGEGVQIVGEDDFKAVRAIALGDDSDNVRYDGTAKRFYVGYGSGALGAVDPADGRVLGQARLAGHPESFQLESSGSRIFVNVPSAGHIAVVDRQAMKVTATWAVTSARSNYPMALDEAGHRLFIGCRRPATVLVFDTMTGKEIGAAEIVGDTDDMFYDAARQRLYVSGGDGFIDVLDARQPAALVRLSRIATAAGARTSLFAPDQNRLYLAVPHRGAQRAEIRIYDVRN
jgi:DNA-binding beta-propeller fold protein YncE